MMESDDKNEDVYRWEACHESFGRKNDERTKGVAHLAMMGSSSDGSARMSRMSSGRSYASIRSLVKMDDWSVIVWAGTAHEHRVGFSDDSTYRSRAVDSGSVGRDGAGVRLACRSEREGITNGSLTGISELPAAASYGRLN